MDDLAELQALLGAVQKQEVKYRLNERNCKELLLKLIEKQLIKVIVTQVDEYLLPAPLSPRLHTRTRRTYKKTTCLIGGLQQKMSGIPLVVYRACCMQEPLCCGVSGLAA